MPSLCDAFRSVPVRCKVERDINLMKEVPELYVWPREEEEEEAEDVIAIVDLNDDMDRVVDQVRAACEECAVFQIVNHGVKQELLERMSEQSRRLFSLPLEQKMLAQRSPDGASGYGMVRISNFFNKLMWSEGFTCIGSPSHHAQLLWPLHYQDFCKVVEEYESAMKNLATKVLSLILQSLGVKERAYYGRWRSEEEEEEEEEEKERDVKMCGSGALQMNHYPCSPCPSRTMGMAAHTDSALLTVLYQGGVQGLQIKRSNGTWMLVPALPNAFVVNIGDLLQVISNGRYKSVVHRAVNNIRRGRLSLAYIWGPPLSAVIEAAPELVDSEHPQLYRSLTWHEYLVARAKHFNKALQFFTNDQVIICDSLTHVTSN